MVEALLREAKLQGVIPKQSLGTSGRAFKFPAGYDIVKHHDKTIWTVSHDFVALQRRCTVTTLHCDDVVL